MTTIGCTIAGEPVPQGSKRIVRGRLIETNDAKLRPWRDACAIHLLRARAGRSLRGPVEVTIVFRLRRPKRLTEWWQRLSDWHATRPDVDKLTRAVLDALTDAEVIGDDGQVARLLVDKRYAIVPEPTGVLVSVRQLLEEPG